MFPKRLACNQSRLLCLVRWYAQLMNGNIAFVAKELHFHRLLPCDHDHTQDLSCSRTGGYVCEALLKILFDLAQRTLHFTLFWFLKTPNLCAIRSIEVAMLARTAKYLSMKVTRKDLCRFLWARIPNLSQTFFNEWWDVGKVTNRTKILPASTSSAYRNAQCCVSFRCTKLPI